MGGFENDRKWIIEKKNDVAIRTMDLEEKIDEYEAKKTTIEEGISRIPHDLPDELNQKIQDAIDNARAELDREAADLRQEADDIKDTADETTDMVDILREDYSQKAESLRKVSDIPIIGRFAADEADKLCDQAEQITDLRQETVQYRDEASMQYNRVIERI